MARKFTASKTQLRPDPRFGSKLAGKFINCVMHDGKKSMQTVYDLAAKSRVGLRFNCKHLTSK